MLRLVTEYVHRGQDYSRRRYQSRVVSTLTRAVTAHGMRTLATGEVFTGLDRYTFRWKGGDGS